MASDDHIGDVNKMIPQPVRDLMKTMTSEEVARLMRNEAALCIDDCQLDRFAAALLLAAQAVEASRIRDTETELPADRQECLCDAGAGWFVAQWIGHRWRAWGVFDFHGGVYPRQHVKRWMPLPRKDGQQG